MNATIDLLNAHRSIRAFTDQPIETFDLHALIQAGQAAATSSFIQACTVINVTDAEKRQALAQFAGNQAYVTAAPVFLVFCADMKRHQLACQMHDAPMQSGFTEQFITATTDCALFAQNVIVAAESLEMGGVYIGGLRNNIAAVSELLELPELVYPVFGMCLGYPDQNPEVKPRLPLPVVLKTDRYTDTGDQAHLAEYDEVIREYYKTRTGGQKDMSWTEQISGMLVKEARPHMLPFLKDKGYLLK